MNFHSEKHQELIFAEKNRAKMPTEKCMKQFKQWYHMTIPLSLLSQTLLLFVSFSDLQSVTLADKRQI